MKDYKTTKTVSVSFIIPAYNEELYLQNTLECIVSFVPKSLTFEIIVADNGSEDNTVNIAKQYANVLVNEKATVAGLRNLAVRSSKGDILVFLDADVLLTEEWSNNFLSSYNSLQSNPYQVTGSRCAITPEASWIEKVWFKPLITQEASYINSGHLITSKIFFNEIGGFDETLETGEDYAFGISARNINAEILNNPALKVVHEGYPKSIVSFIKRESWHGKGDCKSLKQVLASKVALAALGFIFLHLVFVIGLVAGNYMISSISLLLILFVCLIAAIRKHKVKEARIIMQVGFLYYFYLIARFFSCVPSLNNRVPRGERSK